MQKVKISFIFTVVCQNRKNQGKYILIEKNIIKNQYFSINILTMHIFCDKIGNVKVNFVIFETNFQENEKREWKFLSKMKISFI